MISSEIIVATHITWKKANFHISSTLKIHKKNYWFLPQKDKNFKQTSEQMTFKLIKRDSTSLMVKDMEN